MKLHQVIDTNEDLANWKAKLLEQSNEVLVELLLDKMLRDSNLCSEIYFKLVSSGESIESTIDNYEAAIESEMNNRHINVDQILTLSVAVIQSSQDDLDLYIQLKSLISVIISLNNAINQGAGMEDDSDFIIFEKMDEALGIMLKSIEEKHRDLSADELGKVHFLLEDKAEAYSSVDGSDRIDVAFKKLVELTAGRTRLNRNGTYIRGAEYYSNLVKRKEAGDSNA